MPACPKCGCQILDPFRGTIIIHDVEKCTGYRRNAEAQQKAILAERYENRTASNDDDIIMAGQDIEDSP